MISQLEDQKGTRRPTATDARQRLLAAMPVTERRMLLAGISTAVLEGGSGSPMVLLRIKAPTTLVWGRHDLQVPVRVAQAASARYNWPLHVIEGARDDPAYEEPVAFLRALRSTLGNLTRQHDPSAAHLSSQFTEEQGTAPTTSTAAGG